MRPLTLAVCVTVLAALVVGSCGCTSLLNKPAATPQTSASPNTGSGGISDLFLSVLTSNLEKGGYTMVTPFTNTTANGQTIYVATATKGGDTFALTYYPASSSNDASSIQQQQINKYAGLGYVQSPDSTSTEWIGLLSSTQGVGVQLLDSSPVEGVLVILGASPSPIPVPTPVPTPTPQSVLPTQASVSGPTSVVQGQPATFTATLYSVNEHINVCGAVNYYVDNYAAGGSWNINPAGSCSASSGSLVLAGTDTKNLSPGTHTLKIDWLGNSEYGPSQAVMTFSVTPSPAPTPTPQVTISFDGANEISHGAVFELSAIVMQGNTPVTTGTVTFSLAGQTYTATQTDSSGIAGRWTSPQFSPITQVGPYTATASYTGPAGTASTTLPITVT